MTSDERHDDFDTSIVDCAECGTPCRIDEWERIGGRPLCKHCACIEVTASPFAAGAELVDRSMRARYREVIL